MIGLLSLLLASCGGGAGTVGTASGTTLFTSAASSITIPISSVSYTIGGGTAIYKSTSSNPSVASTNVSGNNLSITGIAAGTTQITVTDAVGATVVISVTVGGGTSNTNLYVTAPSTFNIGLGVSNTYNIGGGTPNYIVSSSNTAVATVGINGGAFIVNGISAGTAQVVIFDATGNSVSVIVTVGSSASSTALYVASASALTLPANSTWHSYIIGGGSPNYSASSSNTNVAIVEIASNTLLLATKNAGTAQVLVFDSTGNSVSITVTVGTSSTATPLYVTSASSLTFNLGTSDIYTLGGGSGTYSVSSSNKSIVTATANGTQLTIQGLAVGNAEISIFDTAGASISIDVTVVKNSSTSISVLPEGASGNVGDTLKFLVNAGTPNYTVTVNNPSIASVTPTSVVTNGGSFTASLLNAGSTDVTITDATGQTKSFTLTVNQLSTSLRLSPSSLTLSEDNINTLSLNIYGGTAPYTAFTSDQTLTSVSTTGSVLSIGLGTKANRCIDPIDSSGVRVPFGTFDVTITVVDSLGASATSILTIKDNGIGNGGAVQGSPFTAPCL